MIEIVPRNIYLSWAPLTHGYVESSVGYFRHPCGVVDMTLVLGDRLKGKISWLLFGQIGIRFIKNL